MRRWLCLCVISHVELVVKFLTVSLMKKRENFGANGSRSKQATSSRKNVLHRNRAPALMHCIHNFNFKPHLMLSELTKKEKSVDPVWFESSLESVQA